jgi:hypothetical protein
MEGLSQILKRFKKDWGMFMGLAKNCQSEINPFYKKGAHSY